MAIIRYKNSDSSRPLSTGAAAVYHYRKSIEAAHTLKDRFGEVYKNCKVIGRKALHPKILLPRMRHKVGAKDLRELGTDINITFKGKPRNKDQERVMKEMADLYEAGKTGFIINASTGFGKTFLGCYGMSLLETTTLVLITKSDLEAQWRQSFKDFLGFKNTDIGVIKGDSHSIAGKKVVIGYVQSVMKDDRYPSWVYKYFGFVITDEVHQIAADKFVNCMWLLPALYRLGLSATTDRSDHRSHIFKDHIGPVKIFADVLPMKFEVIKILTDVEIPRGIYYVPGRMARAYKYLAKQKKRQSLISLYVKAAYKKDRTVVCFADHREHLKTAFDSLVDSGVKPDDIGWYTGGMTERQLKKNAFKKVILSTYRMTSVGTDYPHWDTAVFMTPRADVRQPAGRVLRLAENKKKPLLLDFVDDGKILGNYWKSRYNWYLQKADIIRER